MFRLRRFAFLWIGVTILTGGAGQAARAQNATISLKAKEVNGVPVGMTNHVVVSPGDVIKAEIRISGWAPALLAAYSVCIDTSTFRSGDCGRLYPVGYDNPHPELGCNSDIDCPEGLICWKPDGNTPTYCTGPNHDPTQGLYLDPDEWVNVCWRPDYVFSIPSALCIDDGLPPYCDLSRCCLSASAFPGDAPADDGADKYAGTLKVEASEFAIGTFTIAMVPGYADIFLLNDAGHHIPVTIENLTVEVASGRDCPLAPIASQPPHCAIDPGQTAEPGVLGQQGWRSMEITFGEDPLQLTIHDFRVFEVPAGDVANSLFSVASGPRADTLQLTFVHRISPSAWTCVEYLGPVADGAQSEYCIGFLPGDVNADGVSTADDVAFLVDCLIAVPPATCSVLAYCDVDRSGVCTPADVLRTIDLLNGGSALAAWMGQSMDAACPAGR